MNNGNHEMSVQEQKSDVSQKRSLKIISVGFSVVVLLMVFLVTFGLSRLHIINQQLDKGTAFRVCLPLSQQVESESR